MNKIEKIAKKIIGFQWSNIKIDLLKDIEEIHIIIDYNFYNDNRTNKRTASNSFYNLNEIKQLLSCKPVRIEFQPRKDGMNDINRINIDNEECINILKNLDKSKFNKTLFNENPPTDVYKWFSYKRKNDTEIDLYIKFCIEGKKNRKHVLLISIHEDVYI